MSDEYKVDLSKLEDVRRRLNGLLQQMNATQSDATYKTSIPVGYLGEREDRFSEAGGLRNAHTNAQTSIGNIIKHLGSLIDAYGTKTASVQGEYENREAEVKSSMNTPYAPGVSVSPPPYVSNYTASGASPAPTVTPTPSPSAAPSATPAPTPTPSPSASPYASKS